ncbi:hypothetical protein LF1_09830 [Rubripirellula obstinata]|uniref:Uncharacterized protein n=1 Tax=Rubripirellula obstinata TaxID=406547 RepID=A0A5B1CG21_9BACT|nr:hypothetical protein LF1_09830 [Rubripirellula obstinata]
MLSALRAYSFFVVLTGGFATGKGLPPLRGLGRRPGPEGRKHGAGGAATGVLILVVDQARRADSSVPVAQPPVSGYSLPIVLEGRQLGAHAQYSRC